MKKINQKGFTLLEILLVVATIGILASIVILALNPVKQLGDTRNARRESDVSAILNAIYQYTIDNNGDLPLGLDSETTTSQILGTADVGCDTACGNKTTVVSCADLEPALVPTYIVEIPKDPASGTTLITDYYINKTLYNRIEVGACDPEQGETIEINR